MAGKRWSGLKIILLLDTISADMNCRIYQQLTFDRTSSQVAERRGLCYTKGIRKLPINKPGWAHDSTKSPLVSLSMYYLVVINSNPPD